MTRHQRPKKAEARREVETEQLIENRSTAIMQLIDELVSGTKELKALYVGDPNDKPKPAGR